MLLIDANVILRYLLGDNPEMSPRARDAISAGAYTTMEVLAEVVYVLKGVYKAERGEICSWLSVLLDDVGMEHRPVALYALRVFSETSLDFVDCVLIAYNRIESRHVFSFDKKLNKLLTAE